MGDGFGGGCDDVCMLREGCWKLVSGGEIGWFGICILS